MTYYAHIRRLPKVIDAHVKLQGLHDALQLRDTHPLQFPVLETLWLAHWLAAVRFALLPRCSLRRTVTVVRHRTGLGAVNPRALRSKRAVNRVRFVNFAFAETSIRLSVRCLGLACSHSQSEAKGW